MIRNIIFDWSGTLVDDLPAVWRATNYVLEQARREPMTLEQFRAEFCLPFKIFYDRHVPGVPLPELEVWFHGSFRQAQESVVALPHAREFLEFCRRNGWRTFLLSTVHEDHYQVQAATTGFGEYLERAYVGVLDKTKMIHRILEENNLRPEETVFIGDMQHDIDTAKHGGIGSCAVLTGYNNLEQLRASAPDLIVEHLGELQTILERNNGNLKSVHPSGADLMPIVTVGALILNESGQVILVRTHKWSNLWGIPGGKIKWGEDSLAALRREIKEETNLEITDIRFVLVQDCIHSPEFYRDAHFVLLNYSVKCVGHPDVKLNDEAREFKWLTVTDALKMPINQPTRILLEAFQKMS
ncbi:MAG TPA: NUDIX domain-containing protein [Verrucomicrobiae bacterium]|nr:NUDIX domain-containing protein [Verrucomicrobiae bacterium]